MYWQETNFTRYSLISHDFYIMIELFTVLFLLVTREISNLTLNDMKKICSLQHIMNNSIVIEIHDEWKKRPLETPDFGKPVSNTNDTFFEYF